MKTKPAFMTGAIALVLSFLISFGTTESMVTGFQLSVEPRWLPAAACLAGGFLACLLSSRRGGGWVLLALTAGVFLHLWRRSALPLELWQLVYRITHHYDAAYGWGVFKLVDTPWNAGSAQLPMALLGAVTAACTAHSILGKKGALGPLLLSLLPLVSCLVVTDTVPALHALFPLLLGQILLLLGSHIRRRDSFQADRLILMALIPSVIFLGSIFSLFPKESYVNHSEQMQAQILDWIAALPLRPAPQESVSITAGPQREAPQVALSQLGPRQDPADPVLTLLSDAGGALYLRGQDYDRYDGQSWTASPYRVEPLGCEGTDLGILTIETVQPMAQLYLPYYPQGGLSLIGGQVENSRLSAAYSFRRRGLPEGWTSPAPAQADYSGVDPVYLSLPPATLAGAESLLPPILRDQETIAQQVSAIAAFVRDRCPYDLNTEKMPDGEEDFALWFLNKAPSGYCVHYATAAVVLLRSAGIPARYVSGYLVHPEGGTPHTVTQQQAHAWAEYYEPGLNAWLAAEATPAAGIPAVIPPPAAPTTPPSVPPTTEPPAEPADTATPTFETAPSRPPEPEAPAPTRSLPLWLLYPAGGILLLLIQPKLRQTLRRRKLSRAAPNRRCLLLWQEAETLSRLLKVQPPKDLEDLALKARFSQHTITAQELSRFDTYLRDAGLLLRQQPWYQRLLSHFLYALI